MDDRRLDAVARAFAAPGTRRGALGALAGGGLLGALGRGRAPAPAAAQGGTCTLAFAATVRTGPGAQQVLTPGGDQPGELRGELSFALTATGAIDNGALRLPDGTELPVVGQATGRSLQLRIDAGQGQAVVAIGVGEQDLTACQGAVDGLATGPQAGDLGDWHATTQAGAGGGTGAVSVAAAGATRAARGGSAGSGGGSAGGASSATRAPRSEARATSVPDLDSQPTAEPTTEATAEPTTEATTEPATEPTTEPTAETASCPEGQTTCSGACVDLASDGENCGGCGVECAYGDLCSGGTCQPICGHGDSKYCNGACVDTRSDASNCGTCFQACGAGESCLNGACVCTPPATDCGGACVDTGSDPANCGACGTACAADQVCSAGACACPAGTANCGGFCLGCPPGLALCGACVCSDLQTDALNCGACGNFCPAGGFCEGGVCVERYCPEGLTLCGDVCIDTTSDPNHCGECNSVCFGGADCENGQCV